MRIAALLIPVALLALAGCRKSDPLAELEISGLETYWVIDRSMGGTNYLAPVARFHVRNKSHRKSGSVQATLTFHRKGEEQLTWGSDWKQVAPATAPLAPGQSVLVLMKSDARYSSTGQPETFFSHALFKDVNVEVFLRAGSSAWVKFAQVDVDRRIGTRDLPPGITAPDPGAPGSPASPAPGPDGASPASTSPIPVPPPAASPVAPPSGSPAPR